MLRAAVVRVALAGSAEPVEAPPAPAVSAAWAVSEGREASAAVEVLAAESAVPAVRVASVAMRARAAARVAREGPAAVVASAVAAEPAVPVAALMLWVALRVWAEPVV